MYINAIILYCLAKSESLPFDEIEMLHGHPDLYKNKLEEIIKTPDDSDIGYFPDFELRCLHNIKEKTEKFPFCPEKKIIPKDKYNDCMKKIKTNNLYRSQKNMWFVW